MVVFPLGRRQGFEGSSPLALLSGGEPAAAPFKQGHWPVPHGATGRLAPGFIGQALLLAVLAIPFASGAWANPVLPQQQRQYEQAPNLTIVLPPPTPLPPGLRDWPNPLGFHGVVGYRTQAPGTNASLLLPAPPSAPPTTWAWTNPLRPGAHAPINPPNLLPILLHPASFDFVRSIYVSTSSPELLLSSSSTSTLVGGTTTTGSADLDESMASE